MSNKKNGGPAFPTTPNGGKGMSLRDYIAAGVLAGLAAKGEDHQEARIKARAKAAYAYADAMLEAREQ